MLMRNTYRILARKPEESVGGQRPRYKDNIKKNFKGICYEGADWIGWQQEASEGFTDPSGSKEARELTEYMEDYYVLKNLMKSVNL